eukprot:UN31272
MGHSTIKVCAPDYYKFYKDMIPIIKQITDEEILYTIPDFDPHAIVLYKYDQEGDFISAHFDQSYYANNARRYTVLLTLINKGTFGIHNLSHSRLKLHHEVWQNTTNEFATKAGDLIIFNGEPHRGRLITKHSITKMHKDEERVVP